MVPGMAFRAASNWSNRALEIRKFRQDDSEIDVQVCVAPVKCY
jgi:hypothetical protein